MSLAMSFYLTIRNRHFYYRQWIPSDCQQFFPYPEIKFSLKTTSRSVVIKHVKILAAKSEQLFMVLREKPQRYHSLPALRGTLFCGAEDEIYASLKKKKPNCGHWQALRGEGWIWPGCAIVTATTLWPMGWSIASE